MTSYIFQGDVPKNSCLGGRFCKITGKASLIAFLISNSSCSFHPIITILKTDSTFWAFPEILKLLEVCVIYSQLRNIGFITQCLT